MSERTRLALVPPLDQVCASCARPVALVVGRHLCPRCHRHEQLAQAVQPWTDEQRQALVLVVEAMAMTLPPEDVGWFAALVGQVVASAH